MANAGPATGAGLARSLSFEEMAAQAAALRLRVVERADASLDAFMVERMGTMLRLRNYPEELKLGLNLNP